MSKSKLMFVLLVVSLVLASIIFSQTKFGKGLIEYIKTYIAEKFDCNNKRNIACDSICFDDMSYNEF